MVIGSAWWPCFAESIVWQSCLEFCYAMAAVISAANNIRCKLMSFDWIFMMPFLNDREDQSDKLAPTEVLETVFSWPRV